MLGFTGAIESDVSVAGVTVRVVELFRLPDAAVIVALPAERAENNPFDATWSTAFATAVFEDVQLACAVKS
jgi:hypothetical protein